MHHCFWFFCSLTNFPKATVTKIRVLAPAPYKTLIVSGSRKGGLSKGAFCAKQTFLQGNGLPSAALQGNGLPSAVVTRHPLGLGKSVQSRTGSAVANPICKCRCHKAGHLQVRVAVGRRSTCVLKEALLNQGPLGLPQLSKKPWKKKPCFWYTMFKG